MTFNNNNNDSTGSSSNWGGFMEQCYCGLQTKIQTVTKNNHNHGRKFRGCGNFPPTCKFFDWLYDDGANKCAGCEKMSQTVDMTQQQIDSLTEKVVKLKDKNKQLKDASVGLELKLCEVYNERNMWKYGGLIALCVSWMWFTFVLSGK